MTEKGWHMALSDGPGAQASVRQSEVTHVVALVGNGPPAASVLRMLSGVESISVEAVCSTAPGSPVLRLAEELGIFASSAPTDVFQVPGLELIVDMSDDPNTHAILDAQRPAGVELLGKTGSALVLDLLVAKKRGEEQDRQLVELQMAYDRIRGHERRLETSKADLEAANTELEVRLSEIFFTHEFFKALTSFTTVDDVCSLVVDGCNGILGAEISCVYLFHRSDWTLRLRASQGRPEAAFRAKIPVSESILGHAFREGAIQEAHVDCPSETTSWLTGECEVHSQAAVPLRTGENVIGVIVMASEGHRELTPTELERLTVLGNQSSLSLQNALLHAELERLSVTDRLTDLYNHGYFQQRLEEEFRRSSRFGHTMSLIMLDIDDFKTFNDTFGHVSGDGLLRAVSSVIKANLRTMDVAARYGGEEFVVVLPETDTAGALAVAERIRAGVEQLSTEVPQTVPVVKTISVGVSTFPDHAESALRLLESADAAMYRAKRAGKNRVASAGM
jgi:diguanylate cyclase (GGDEF)-like protein